MLTWPIEMPKCVPIGGLAVSGPAGATIRTPMDAGPAKQRPRFTAAPRSMRITLPPISVSVFEIFENWFEGGLGMGSESFLMDHPITSAPATVRFDMSSGGYSVRMGGANAVVLSLSLEIMP